MGLSREYQILPGVGTVGIKEGRLLLSVPAVIVGELHGAGNRNKFELHSATGCRAQLRFADTTTFWSKMPMQEMMDRDLQSGWTGLLLGKPMVDVLPCAELMV